MDATAPRNWQTELNTVNTKANKKYLRIKSNIPYTIVVLDEGGPDYTSDFEDKPQDRIDLKVKVTGGEYKSEELTWSLTKGGKESLYGKLVNLFVKNGHDTGYTLHIVAEGEGKSKKYQIKEYNDLMFAGGIQ
jgi:hypothetical protein